MAGKKNKGKEMSFLSSSDVDAIRNKDKDEKLKMFNEKMKKSGVNVEFKQVKDRETIDKKDVLPTGVLSVDKALQTFGFPRGRIIELYGEEGSGKTMLSLLAAGNVQRAGGLAMLMDMECAYDEEFGALLGVSDELVVAQPMSAEEAFDSLIEVIESGIFDLIIVDSVANMVPKAEIEGEMGDQQVGLLARIMSKGLRKVTNAIARTKTCLIFINQIRMKIGVMFGDPRTTTGGKALRFYASQRIEVTAPSGGKIKDGDKIIGHHAHVTVRKNKVGPPFGEGDMYVYYNVGIDQVRDICSVAKEEGLIEGTSWLTYKSDKYNGTYKGDDGIIKIQGFENFVNEMRNYAPVIFEMRDRVIEKIEKEREEFQKQRNLMVEDANEKKESGLEDIEK